MYEITRVEVGFDQTLEGLGLFLPLNTTDVKVSHEQVSKPTVFDSWIPDVSI